MSEKRYVIRLSAKERDELKALVKKGKAAAHKRNHAQVLLKTDEGKHGPAWTNTDGHHPRLSSATLAANAGLSLINLCTHLLDKQIEAQAKAFEEEGGFTERMYRIRSQNRKRQ